MRDGSQRLHPSTFSESPMATIPNKIYLVLNKTNNVGRLVRAKSAPQALNHVIDSTHEARLATQEDLVYAVSAGVAVEDIGAKPSASEPAETAEGGSAD